MQSTKTVAIVDDSAATRKVVRSVLSSWGHEVVEAECAQDLLHMLHQHHCDLVISDVDMPEMDGVTLVGEIRKLDQYRTTPILMLTANGREDVRTAAIAAGATGWVDKPFSVADFKTRVQRVL